MDIENTVSIETANIVNNILKGYTNIDLLDIYKRFKLEIPKKSIDFYKMCCSSKTKSGKRCSRKRKNGEWCGLHINSNHKERWCKTDYEKSSFNNADAVVLLTEWEDFKIIKWHEISMLMRKPSWIFDTRAVVNPNEVRDSGINLWRIGEGINKKSYDGW